MQIIVLTTRNTEGTGYELRFAVGRYDDGRYPIEGLVRSEVFDDRPTALQAAAERNRGVGYDAGTEYPIYEMHELQCTFGALVLGDYIDRMRFPDDELAERFEIESAIWSAAEIEAIHDWVTHVGEEFRTGVRAGRPANFRFAREHIATEAVAFNADRSRAEVHTEDVALIVEHQDGTTSEVTAGFDWFEYN